MELVSKNIIGHLMIPRKIIDRAPKAWDKFLRNLPSSDALKDNAALPFTKANDSSDQMVKYLPNRSVVISLIAREYDGQIVLFNAFKPSQLKLFGLHYHTIHSLIKSLIYEKEANIVFKHANITQNNLQIATSRLFVTKINLFDTIYHADLREEKDIPLSPQANGQAMTAFLDLTSF